MMIQPYSFHEKLKNRTNKKPFQDHILEYLDQNEQITINIDYSRDTLLSEAGRAILKDRYFQSDEESPQEVFARASCVFGSDSFHAQRLYEYASKRWFMFASPILANAGGSGLPISCFLNAVDDTRESLGKNYYENIFLSSFGGGIGVDFSKIRPIGASIGGVDNASTGVVPFLKCIDSQTMAYQQGSTRRGATACYLDISHPEIEEFINLRDHRGTDIHRKCLSEGFHHACNIPDAFMEAVSKNEKWALICPNTKKVVKEVSARELWMKILQKRVETGEPYLHFIDTSNKGLHPSLKARGLRINSSNLCNEIYLPTIPNERTAVCCLSSVNLEFYDEWKDDPMFIPTILEMLDNVLDYFVYLAPEVFDPAVTSVVNERSVGLGAMGFALYLQQRSIPFESKMALDLNWAIFNHIRTRANNTSFLLGKEFGSFKDFSIDYPSLSLRDTQDAREDYPESTFGGISERFAHKLAIAPNANISIICGNTSPSIEPFSSNIFKQNTLSGSFFIKNKALETLLLEKYDFKNKQDELEEVWHSIASHQGSVQHLAFMDSHDKSVFKTAYELDQKYIIIHAGVRQPFICQGQSVNIFVHPDISRQELHDIHKLAWEQGLKGLYYCRSKPAINFSPLSRITQKPVLETFESLFLEIETEKEPEIVCIGCEG